MLTVVLIIAAARLASYGAGLVREKEQLKELQQEMRQAEESISSVEKEGAEKEEISVTGKSGEASGAEHVEAKAFKTESSTVEEAIKEISLYDTGRTAVYGQQLLALSTCSYHTENGRFVVVAVKQEKE